MMVTASNTLHRGRGRGDERREIELNAKQYAFVYDDEHKFVAYIGGIGGGKSYAGAVKALREVVAQPGSLGLIGAPTYPMLRDATMRAVFELFPEELVRSWYKSEGHLTLTNGSEILFRSMDEPDRVRGLNLAWCWLDEAPLCGYYAWQVLKGRLRQQGYEPHAWITGSPKGEDRFYEDFELEPQPGHRLYRASTRENAHNLPLGFVEDLGYTGKFALQEIEGLFVSFEGLVYEYRGEWHAGEWDFTDTRHRPALRIGGVDWGYTNPSVALPIWVDGDDVAWLLDEYYQRQAGLAGVKVACCEFARRYGITHWYCGPDEPEHIAELNAEFARQHINSRALAANDEINAGIETVRRQMALRKDGRAGLRVSAKCAQTRGEFKIYAYPSGLAASGGYGGVRGKRDPQEKPVKAFDHGLDATRYALHTALGAKTRHQSLPLDVVREQARAARRISEIGGISIRKRQF